MCIEKRFPRGASGQATLEYLFLVFLTILLVSGFVYQYNGALKNFFNSYFSADGYLACLIEKGLLPGETSDDGVCDLPSFDINSGKTRAVAAVTIPTGGDINYHSQGGPGSGGNFGRSNESGNNNLIPYGGGGAGAHGKDGKKDQVTKKENTGSDSFSTYNGNNSSGNASEDAAAGGSKYVPYTSTSSSTSAKAKKDASVPVTERDLKSIREIAAEKRARRFGRNQESQEFNLSFGNILKWVAIILLLFGIFFFIGSQIVAVSRGKKKNR